MKKVKRIIGRFIYFFARKMPPSFSALKIGQRQIRAFCGHLILQSCGKNVNIEKNAEFDSSVRIGNNSGLGINCRIAPQVTIGDNVMMGPDVLIYTQNHKFSDVYRNMDEQGFDDLKEVHIGDNVWIGARVIILPGVNIGEGSVIGAGAVVSKDVPPFSVFVGNPGRVVKYRKEGSNID